MDEFDREHWAPETLAVRLGQERSQYGEHSEAMFLTSSFVFKDAAQAAARFSGAEPGNVYARFTNPTVTSLQQRLAALEGAEDCIATASGMAAIMATVMALMNAGQHIVASRSIFGATQQMFTNLLPRFGIETSFVDGSNLSGFASALRPNTRIVFVESPSNPLTELVDIAALAEVTRAQGVLLVVDNCFCTPALQLPLTLGADLVIHSATKYLDGQGRVLGGAVCGPKVITDEVFKFLRTAGPTLSPFNAWIILKGLETLYIRMQAQSANALQLALWLEQQPSVMRVYYPGLPTHPQFDLAKRQQTSGGAIVSFEVRGGRDAAWRVVDHCKLLSITANLGDTKTTITHPASTTHGRITAEARAQSGITEGLLRIAVGLEAQVDLQRDLLRGLTS
ncbi:MAG: O-succinylhomoserine sulfhydrylase [Rhodocyclaceae bacterium]|nr:O-succinylhomoserine sulfhydrylase [Rhodocyclaceae bacterium]